MLIKTSAGFRLVHLFDVQCFRRGRLLWREQRQNLIVNTGLDDILDKYWKGSAYTAAHYVGLLSATPTIVAGNTMASHAGWTEVTDYDEADRDALTLGAVSGQSVSNAADRAAFTINGTVTIGGAFITTDDTKGGTAGTLIGAMAFAANRDAEAEDVLNVQVTLTAQSAA